MFKPDVAFDVGRGRKEATPPVGTFPGLYRTLALGCYARKGD